jgi:hypothetical protein
VEGGGIALSMLDLDARWGWVVKATPRPSPSKRPGVPCTPPVVPGDCLSKDFFKMKNLSFDNSKTQMHVNTNRLSVLLPQCVPL